MILLGLILLGVLLNAVAQLLLKAGMIQVGHFEFTLANVKPITSKILINLPIMTGISLYGISVGVWLLVLSRAPVSMAYPMLSMGYVINALAAYYFFGESLTPARLIGIFIIITGVYLVSQSN